MKRYFRFVINLYYGYNLYSSWYDSTQISVLTTLRYSKYASNLSNKWDLEFKDKLDDGDILRISNNKYDEEPFEM